MTILDFYFFELQILKQLMLVFRQYKSQVQQPDPFIHLTLGKFFFGV